MTEQPEDQPCGVGRDFTASDTGDDLDWRNPCPHPSTAFMVYRGVAVPICTCHADAVEREFAQQMEERAASIERTRPWN